LHHAFYRWGTSEKGYGKKPMEMFLIKKHNKNLIIR